jgi:hypothetical protein
MTQNQTQTTPMHKKINSPSAQTANHQENARLIAITSRGEAAILIVGSEVLLRGEFPA